jgi:hypothetical protein
MASPPRVRLFSVSPQHVPFFVPDDGKDLRALLNQQLHAGSVGGQRGTKHTVRNEQFESQVRGGLAPRVWSSAVGSFLWCRPGLCRAVSDRL